MQEQDKIQIKQLYEMGLSRRHITHQFHISSKELLEFVAEHKLTIKTRTWNENSNEELEFLTRAAKIGVSTHTLKDIYHVSANKIEKFLTKMGIVSNSSVNVHTYNINVFDMIDSENKAYWLGYLFADSTNQEKSLNFSVHGSKLQHLKNFASFIGDNPERIKLDGEYAKYKIYSKELFGKLNKLGLISPKTNSVFPEVKDDLYCHFLRGYTDGKSSCSISKNMEWRFNISGNRQILENIITHVPMDLKISKNSSGYDFIPLTGNQRVIQFYNWLYKDASVYLDTKYQQFKQLEKRLTK